MGVAAVALGVVACAERISANGLICWWLLHGSWRQFQPFPGYSLDVLSILTQWKQLVGVFRNYGRVFVAHDGGGPTAEEISWCKQISRKNERGSRRKHEENPNSRVCLRGAIINYP